MRGEQFWKLEHCSNETLLSQLDRILSSGRRLTAELVAHLGEVEERRLHLEAACSSMFDYCLRRLGLSEDEAYRRIEVARLARRFPTLFPLLASGELSLTVAALLKPHLSAENEAHLIAAVKGKTATRAREALAALFPRPDVPEVVRKLPSPRVDAPAPPFEVSAPVFAMWSHAEPSKPVPTLAMGVLVPTVALPAQRPPARIEPLSEARYRVQLSVSADFKSKLDQARDLMRHRNPNGDLEPILERALDLLLEKLVKERFGVTDNPRQRGSKTERVTSATQRSVLARDGMQCSWVDDHGRRCTATGWLEFDHCEPKGKGGGAEPENIRMLCRSHNRLAAERVYGRKTVEAAIARQRREHPSAAAPPE